MERIKGYKLLNVRLLVILLVCLAMSSISFGQEINLYSDTTQTEDTLTPPPDSAYKDTGLGPIIINPASDKNDHYVQPANDQFKAGNWEAGKKIIDSGLNKYPKYSDLHMLLGKYYLHYKNYDKARYELHKALEYDHQSLDARKVLVNVNVQDHRYSAAIGYVNELLQVTPYWRGLWRKKIQIYELQGNKVEARRLRKRINQIFPHDTGLKKDYLYHTRLDAIEKKKNGDVDGAIKLHKEVLNADPDNPQNYVDLVNDYLTAGDLSSALSYAERGLQKFPHNKMLIEKKAGILAEQNRYSELLPFLKENGLTRRYEYYLLQAARNAKNMEAGTLYGKVFLSNPGNREAFINAFNVAVGKQQYGRALHLIRRYQSARGDSKDLELKKLMVYQRMGNKSGADGLTIKLFHQYPQDYDLRIAYTRIILERAKDEMANKQFRLAIKDWRQIQRLGNPELNPIAERAIYSAYLQMGEYNNALQALSVLINNKPDDPDLFIKRAALYEQMREHNQALASYEHALSLADETEKKRYLLGYADMMTSLIKSANERYRYNESKRYVERWLSHDPNNQQALHYAYNLANLTNDKAKMKYYAELGHFAYPEDTYFRIKLAQINSLDPDNYAEVYDSLHADILLFPYNQDLINTFSVVTNKYGLQLIDHRESEKAITKIDTALIYDSDNKTLKYTKGLAYEKLKKYDSALYYQGFHEPSEVEKHDFRQHLYYLNYRMKKNNFGMRHLRTRHGALDSITVISTAEYSRIYDKNTYTARVNYTGRRSGKGFQLQGEWSHIWSDKIYTVINGAWANRYFPEIEVHGAIYKYFNFLDGIQLELGLGYRNLRESELTQLYNIQDKNMPSFVVGITKQFDHFRLNAKLNNYFLEQDWLYNFSVDARYYTSSLKDYVIGVASFGTSPYVQLVNYQLFNGFTVPNVMVGAGMGHMLFKNVSASILGTWINYKYQLHNIEYKNLYNIYLSLDVAF